MAATSTPQAIRDNASYHSRIISEIAKLDYVPSALTRQTDYIRELENQIQQSDVRVKQLSEKTKKERKEHAVLRDSTARRLAHKLTGRKEKFEAKASKEEREYVEALEKEMTERDSQNALRQMLNEANREKNNLSTKATHYESLKKELSDLYLRIFEGPTEEFPEDDRLEYQLQLTQSLHDQIQTGLNAECQSAEILARADKVMFECQQKVNEALTYSRWDMWGGGPGMSDIMERNSLSMAQSLANRIEMLLQQAQNISPAVQPIGRLAVAQGSLMSDIFFDNIFTDMAFHEKIKETAADLGRAHSRLRAERDAARQRVNNAGDQLEEVSQTLEADRIKLDAYRRETFLKISQERGTPSSDRPPSYDKTEPPSEGSVETDASSAEVPQVQQPEPISAPEASPSGSSPSNFGPGYVMPSGNAPPTWGSRNPYAAALASRTTDHVDQKE